MLLRTRAIFLCTTHFVLSACLVGSAHADENLFGYVKGAETLPKGAQEVYLQYTRRNDKGVGEYVAQDLGVEYEYGFTSRLTAGLGIKGQAIDTSDIVIDGYLPGDENYGLRASGIEGRLKYNFLSPAKDPIGLAMQFDLSQSWLDAHSGKDKDKTSFEVTLMLQKYFLDGELIWVGNTGLGGTYAKRAPLNAATQASADASIQALTGDPTATFEWPTEPEMEIEFKLGTGLSYRFAPGWFAGIEAQYATEFETEVGQERWSLFAGPTLHYASKQWWATVSWFPQIRGGREQLINQSDTDLHLIEKTKQEVRIKVGFEF